MMYRVIWMVAALALFCFASCDEQPVFPVEYSVTVKNIWSINSHPIDYPQNAHVSPFLVFSHKPATEAFVVGLPATDGIKLMAETGSLTQIQEEVDIFRGGDRALDRSSGLNIVYQQTSTVRLGFNEAHHQLTLLAQIGPSPDWFVATKGLELLQTDGWVQSLTFYPQAYDAGTDLGQTFNSSDFPQEPRNTVQLITSRPLADNGVVVPLVEVKLERIK